jgi:DeoR/GlpR family transcriptional regulator of sugar metabolism
LTPPARRERILSLLRAMQKELRVEELAGLLEVSPLTVRRDLTVLEEERSVIRTHGGCITAGRAARETDYQQKVARNFALKQAIGRAAAALVNAGETVLVNDGSTTFHLVSSVVAAMLSWEAPRHGRPGGRPHLTMYTNSIAMLAEVARCPGIALYLIGGKYDDEDYSLSGSFAEAALDSLRADLVFLGADAIDEKGRLLVPTPEEARLTRAMLRSGRRAILLADHTKVGAASTVAYGTLADVEQWITTPGIEALSLKRYRKLTTVLEARP